MIDNQREAKPLARTVLYLAASYGAEAMAVLLEN